MSDKPKAATPSDDLLADLMNPNIPKSEREHAAVREIERLREALAEQPAQQEPVAEVKAKMTGGNVGIATVIHEIHSPLREPLQPGDKLYAAYRWIGWDVEQVWSERIFGIDMRFENVQDAIAFREKLDEATTPQAQPAQQAAAVMPCGAVVSNVYEAYEAGKKAQPAQQEPVVLPCCGYTDASAVKWNPYNQVVQCHNCGQVYTTPQAQP